MKILIAVLYSTIRDQGLERLLNEFEQAGYHIHIFEKVEENVAAILELPNIMNCVKDMEEGSIERTVVVSNISEFIFSWYRCYNSLADDFIYYIDDLCTLENKTIVNQIPNADFYEKLFKFNNIGEEQNEGRIYINIKPDNFKKISRFLLLNNNFKYFDVYSNFDFFKKSEKELINKSYLFNGLQYSFIIKQDNRTAQINIDKNSSPDKEIFPELCKLLETHYDLAFYILLTIKDVFQHGATYEEVRMVYQRISFNDQAKDAICQCFKKYCNVPNTSFSDKVIAASLMVAIGIRKDIYCKIMSILLKDDKNIEKHYPFLINSLFYQSLDGIMLYPEIYHDREQEFNKIVNFYKEKVAVRSLPKRKEKHILIHVVQLLSLQHSPTLCALNYAKYLKKFYPDYKIKIFVEDIFRFKPAEIQFPYAFGSALSASVSEVHHAFLQGTDIAIYYSDHSKSRTERIKEDLKQVYKFAPEYIVGFSTVFSIVRGFLYKDYPIVDITLGGLSNSQYADVFLHSYEQAYMEQECGKYNYSLKNLAEGRIVQMQSGLSFIESHKILKRSDYNISKNDFVMITVGNRLDGEVSDRFIDMIHSFMNNKPDVKWIIVGRASLPYLRKKYAALMEQQVIFIDYQKELAALYQICDVFVNPFRQTGGYSGAMAMSQGLPVVTLNELSDVMVYTGVENSVTDEAEYVTELNRLYKDVDYRIAKGNLMKQRIEEKFSFRIAIDDLVECFEKASQEFSKRTR